MLALLSVSGKFYQHIDVIAAGNNGSLSLANIRVVQLDEEYHRKIVKNLNQFIANVWAPPYIYLKH